MTRTYLVESYWPGVSERQVARTVTRAAELRDIGVCLLHAVLIPADEIVLSLFEGPSAEAVFSATRRVGLPCERVVESVRLPGRPIDDENGSNQ